MAKSKQMDPLKSASPRDRKRALTWGIVVFIVGFLVRLALVVPHRPSTLVEKQEPVQIALSLAATGRYADAYGAGSGPTAHCAPLHPVLLSIIFRIFGVDANGALAVEVFGSAAAALAFALLPALAVAGGIGLSSGALAGLAGALLPINYWAQTSGSFDAPFTAAMLTALCLLVCRVWAAALFTKPEAVVFGIASGFGCLLSSSLIPVLTVWSVFSIVRFMPQWRRVLAFLVVAALVVFAILTPWAIRNRLALGSIIWTRSNFGVELSASNNDNMTADEEYNVRQSEFALLHPLLNGERRDEVRTVGEVAFNHSERQQAITWIASHKRRFLLLTVERFELFWLPHMHRPWQSVLEAVLSLLGLCGLGLLFWERNGFAWVALAVLVAFPAVYWIIQVSPRYRFPMEPLLFLLAANLFVSAVGNLAQFYRSGRSSR
jgi:MFS family permease